MPDDGRETTADASFLVHHQLDRAIVAHAVPQHAVLSLGQLTEVGMAPSSVRGRANARRLHRIYRGVYALVPESLLTAKGRWMAAVLACGPGAVLSHQTAAALHGLRRTDRAKVDVTVPRRSRRAHPGIDVHRSTILTDTDVTTVGGIPCTTVARTLLDLAAVLQRRPVERAFDQAEMERVLSLRAIDDLLRRNPTHQGARVVKAILAEHYVGTTPTVNEYEEAFFAICRRIDVPIPEVNQWVDLHDGAPPIKADFLWREQRVIVETDSVKYHGTHQARQRDPRRDQRAMLAGWRTVRTTWQQVMRRPGELETILPRLLGIW
jgi:predicted transcriptional regulator of viral defense system